jgi:hypothetical protein
MQPIDETPHMNLANGSISFDERGIRILESTRHEAKSDLGGVDLRFLGWVSVSDIDSALVFI